MSKRGRRLSPDARERLKALASRATAAQLGERFGLSADHVGRILAECPDCATCGRPTPPGTTLCQRCAEDEVIAGVRR